MSMTTTREPSQQRVVPWAASVYYVHGALNSTIEKAWTRMLNYEAWNPSFAGAHVTLIRGQRRCEGELILIKKAIIDSAGQPWPEFYAETVKLVPSQHIVWYIYPKEGDAFRNFVDFGLAEDSSGLSFNIHYYAQSRVAGDALLQQRKEMEIALGELVAAFKAHCEI
jgi:hypothetical protein